MKARPILFTKEMICALLAGRKTQTRRVVKPQPITRPGMNCTRLVMQNRNGTTVLDTALGDPLRLETSLCPYGQPGDLLWVRETWQGLSFGDYMPTKSQHCNLRYAATDAMSDFVSSGVHGYPWRPSIHMPRWASRLTLRITDVRVERLQSISESDAIAEGMTPVTTGRALHGESLISPPQSQFSDLWEHINGPGSWDKNPWVWALTFEVITENVDDVMRKGGEA